MKESEELRKKLIEFVKRKFYSRQDICILSDDIVNQSFVELYQSPTYDKQKENFGYLSKACIHIAFQLFKDIDNECKTIIHLDNLLEFVDSADIVEEIIQSNDTADILQSLETLREIEKTIILQHYYRDFTFSEISKANNIKLNTVLSHHRRALEKLRSSLLEFSEDKILKTTLPANDNPSNGFTKFL